MKRAWGHALLAGLVLLGLLAVAAATPAAAQATDPSLQRIAAANGRSEREIEKILDDPAAKVGAGDRIFFVDTEPEGSGKTPVVPALVAPAAAPFPYASTFRLHSRLGSPRVIYLDFDGHDIAGTAWNSYAGTASISAEPFSLDGTAAFSEAEQAVIQSVWQRVAEDYAIFDVDVTTEDPGPEAITRSGWNDEVFGTRVAITENRLLGDTCGCYGAAYLGAFAATDSHGYFQPALAFSGRLGNDAKRIAETASHEAGHTLALYHDGFDYAAYYAGHGGWAPIMGFPLDRPITQWSRGEYGGANNTQDDIATIAAVGAPLLTDDHGDTIAAATSIDGRPSVAGLVSSDGDVDVFRVRAGAGGASFTVDPAPESPNLDVLLELRSMNGTLLASDDPPSAMVSSERASGLGASISLTMPAGDYALLVTGVGSGSPVDGYGGYGSVGSYTLRSQLNRPSVIVTSTPNPSRFGSPVAFTASVGVPSGATVTGSVTFKDGPNPMCSNVPIGAGTATCSWPLGAGRHPVTAVYSGNATFSESFSAVYDQVVDGDDTTVTLTSSPNPSLAGQPVAFRAAVAATGGDGIPTGTVTFTAGSQTLCAGVGLEAGVATCSQPLAAGTAAVSAAYRGSYQFDAASSAALSQVVERASPTVTLTSSANPVPSGARLVVTASVASGGSGAVVATGLVDITEGSAVLCSALPLSGGQASCEISLPRGNHDLTATYRGDTNFRGNTSPALTQVVDRSNTTIRILTFPDVTAAGEDVSFRATLNGSGGYYSPGQVTVYADGAVICTDAGVSFDGYGMGSASCTAPLLTGHHQITAAYSGDADRAPATAEPWLHVVGLARTNVALAASTTTTTRGGPVLLSASVSPVVAAMGLPTGSVTFMDGQVPICAAVPLIAGQAVCTTSFGAGNHPVRADYSGNAVFSLAVSPATTVVVAGEPVTVDLASSMSTSVWGQPVAFQATVAGAGGPPSGTVSFFDNVIVLCADVPLRDGAATCTTGLNIGSRAVSAVYSGDERFDGGASVTLRQTVAKAASTVANTTARGPVRTSPYLEFSATVAVDAPGAGIATGNVAFRSGEVPICTGYVSVSSPTARCWSQLLPGVHRISAAFAGDYGVLASSAPSFDLTVLPAGDEFVPVQPKRLLDTRVGIGGPASPVGPRAVRDVVVRGGATGIPDGATSVVVNTTVTGSTAPSYLTVWPAGRERPNTSNLNFLAGQTIPNLVMVEVGAGGRISAYNLGGFAHVIVDVVGYHAPTGGATFTPVTPTRLLDTRTGTGGPASPFGPGASRELLVRGGATGIPDNATAVVLNTTAVTPTASSYLTVYPSSGSRPTASNLNFVAGQTIPNLVVVGVGAGGRISIFNAVGSVHVLADIVGYYAPVTGSTFTPVTPTRAYDTRLVNSVYGSAIAAGASRNVPIAGGSSGVPGQAKAVVLNVTVAFATEGSYLTVHPYGVPRPLASNLNFGKDQIIPNLVVTGLGTGGAITIFNAAGSVHVVVDVVGYMS